VLFQAHYIVGSYWLIIALELLEAYFGEFEEPAHGFFMLIRDLIAWKTI
jgi:hypothetical protein